jgi:hypothetical protein
MQGLTTLAKQKRGIKMKTKNNWNWCRQARWETGERVELFSRFDGTHEIRVAALGMDMSYTLPSYAGIVQYEKWVREVQDFLDGNADEEQMEYMAHFVDTMNAQKENL